MHTTILRMVGGSIMLAIPPAILDLLHLRSGATVGLAVERGRLVIEPTLRPRNSLDELLAQCDASADLSAEERAWLDNKPVGKRAAVMERGWRQKIGPFGPARFQTASRGEPLSRFRVAILCRRGSVSRGGLAVHHAQCPMVCVCDRAGDQFRKRLTHSHG
jgi:antitoxin ChpS